MSNRQRLDLDQFCGSFPRQALNARRVAGALDAPGCQRRTLIDAASINIDKLGALLTGSSPDRQSPYAISRGNQFEERVTANGMAEIVSLARKHLALEIPEVRQCDLSAAAVKAAHPDTPNHKLNERRVTLTKQKVAEMLRNPLQGHNLIRHAMTRLTLSGRTVYLEQDVLAFAAEGGIHVVEIKSYPRVDGRADPAKASDTIRQSAVYVLSLRHLVEEIGAENTVVSSTILIVLPENLSFTPTAVIHDIELAVRRLQRQLALVATVDDILDGLPGDLELPGLPGPDADVEEKANAAQRARDAIAPIPAKFDGGCVTCPLFAYCRGEADRHGSVARLGQAVAGACGAVSDITAALDLASGRRDAANSSEAAVAVSLARGAAAAALAREELR